MAQYAIPYEDVDDGGWLTYYQNGTPGNNVDMWNDINDGSAPDDTNMIRSGLTPSNDTYSCKLTGVTSPAAGTVTIRLRARFA